MTKVGYARVSSTTQNLDSQLEKLKNCEKIFKEQLSGTNLNRPQFKKMMDFLREGDVLYVTKLDRLARNTKDLLNIKHLLEQKSVKLIVTDQGIDTTTPVGNLLFGMLSVYAEFENDLRKENQRDGIFTARNRGVTFGRKKSVSTEQFLEIKKMRDDGFLIKQIMEKYKISKATTYRILSMQKEITLE
jgi:DNA invertase Pin-like site-specific DNA recombinase